MRTTVRLDDDLLTETKQLAARTGRTLTEVISDALREVLARLQKAGKRPRVRLTTFGGDGVLPGVDLDNFADLLDRMDDPDVSRRR